MILLTVGTQLPFDRLVAMLDELPGSESMDIFAQIGNATYIPSNFAYSRFLDSDELDKMHQDSDFIIAHAGMGSILTALKFQKPIIVMPRLAVFGEHRNDHQLATVEQFKGVSGVFVALDKTDLLNQINNIKNVKSFEFVFNEFASEELLDKLQLFIDK